MKRRAISYVYFLKPVGHDGPIKIGCSQSPAGRFRIFTSWSPIKLEMIGQLPGDEKVERFIHSRFADLHSHCEWFNHSADLAAAISAMIATQSVDVIRHLPDRGEIHRAGATRTPEQRRHRSYRLSVFWALRKLLTRTPDTITTFHAPDNVEEILARWGKNYFTHEVEAIPTADDLALLDAFISDPIAHGARRQTIRLRAAA